jgi:outer membrane protein OmpA-like peptidoglycan-associated protein
MQTKEGQGTAWGAGIGAGLGAIAGAVAGHNGQSALIGAGVGGLLGGVAGNRVGMYMDDQQAELQQKLANQKAVEIQRENNLLRLTFHSDLTFAVNSAVPSPGAKVDLQRVSNVLDEYPLTKIIVAGYTDSRGSEAYNEKLSQRRATAVKDALMGDGVSDSRIKTIGYGPSDPIASNTTAEGRQLNRRVVITIAPEQQSPA